MNWEKEKDLLKRYNEGTCSAEEVAQVESWYIREIERSERSVITDEAIGQSKKIIWNNFLENSQPKAKNKISYYKYALAASLLVILSVGIYFQRKNTVSTNHGVAVKTQEIKPGGNRATLTLADGTRIVLSNAKNGFIANQNNSAITKSEDGMLVYKTSSGDFGNNSPALFNTIDIPKGGQYKLLLPDGTKVWLNSMTSIKYPSNFSGSERRIELNGEAYFEVAKDRSMPFIVKTQQTQVEVLGTHFNVMAYANESIEKTTLLEGLIKVKNRSSSSVKVIQPGYQASIDLGQVELLVAETNVAHTVAWKDGIFQFDRDDIKTIMKKLERWYDIEVIYEGTIPTDQFVGKISRDNDLSEVLNVLSLSKIKYRVQGKKIIISG